MTKQTILSKNEFNTFLNYFELCTQSSKIESLCSFRFSEIIKGISKKYKKMRVEDINQYLNRLCKKEFLVKNISKENVPGIKNISHILYILPIGETYILRIFNEFKYRKKLDIILKNTKILNDFRITELLTAMTSKCSEKDKKKLFLPPSFIEDGLILSLYYKKSAKKKKKKKRKKKIKLSREIYNNISHDLRGLLRYYYIKDLANSEYKYLWKELRKSHKILLKNKKR